MRKLMMITAMALAAIAFGSMTATATAGEGVYVWDDNGPGEYCPEVYESDGEVTGGCLIEDYDGSFELGAFMPAWTTVAQYGLTFDFAVNGSGDGYLVNPTITWYQGGFGTRKACDEADGTPLPWPVESRVVGNEIHMDITMALTPSTTPPGGSCTQQTITVEYDDLGGGSSDLTQVGQSANIKDGYWLKTNEASTIILFSLHEQW